MKRPSSPRAALLMSQIEAISMLVIAPSSDFSTSELAEVRFALKEAVADIDGVIHYRELGNVPA